jgi:protein involved in sex pheromone biosynthesis
MKKLLFFSILSLVLVLGACNENMETAEGEEAPEQEVNNWRIL